MFSKLCRWKNIIFDQPPQFVLLCYSQEQNVYESLYNEGIVNKMIHGYPTYKELAELLKPHKKSGSMLIIDDGLNAINDDLEKIFYELRYNLYNINNLLSCIQNCN